MLHACSVKFKLSCTVSQLRAGDNVWVSDRQLSAIVTEETTPRSYTVDTDDGTFSKNGRHLLTFPNNESVSNNAPEDGLDAMYQDNGDTSSKTQMMITRYEQEVVDFPYHHRNWIKVGLEHLKKEM